MKFILKDFTNKLFEWFIYLHLRIFKISIYSFVYQLKVEAKTVTAAVYLIGVVELNFLFSNLIAIDHRSLHIVLTNEYKCKYSFSPGIDIVTHKVPAWNRIVVWLLSIINMGRWRGKFIWIFVLVVYFLRLETKPIIIRELMLMMLRTEQSQTYINYIY